jgi:hypothetical protein
MAGRRFRATATTTTSSFPPDPMSAAGGRVEGWEVVTVDLQLVGVRGRWWS